MSPTMFHPTELLNLIQFNGNIFVFWRCWYRCLSIKSTKPKSMRQFLSSFVDFFSFFPPSLWVINKQLMTTTVWFVETVIMSPCTCNNSRGEPFWEYDQINLNVYLNTSLIYLWVSPLRQDRVYVMTSLACIHMIVKLELTSRAAISDWMLIIRPLSLD